MVTERFILWEKVIVFVLIIVGSMYLFMKMMQTTLHFNNVGTMEIEAPSRFWQNFDLYVAYALVVLTILSFLFDILHSNSRRTRYHSNT
jgi:uncharacterized membrane protein YecN with MAPEG domain